MVVIGWMRMMLPFEGGGRDPVKTGGRRSGSTRGDERQRQEPGESSPRSGRRMDIARNAEPDEQEEPQTVPGIATPAQNRYAAAQWSCFCRLFGQGG